MAYRLIEFNGVDLPLYNPEQDQSGGEAESTLLDSIGGVFDYYGSRQRLPRRATFDVTGIYKGNVRYFVDENGAYFVDENGAFFVSGSPQNDLRDQVMRLRKQRGKRGNLVRIWQDNGTRQIVGARLLAVGQNTKPEHRDVMVELTCRFEIDSDALWRDEDATTVGGTATAGAPFALVAHNSGDAEIDNAVLTISWASGSITGATIRDYLSGIDLSVTGTLDASGEYLEIDDHAQTVMLGATDAYANLTRGANHTARGWLTLPEGASTLIVTLTGSGTADISLKYRNRWQ